MPRTTPAGRALEGLWGHSYWTSSTIAEGEWRSDDSGVAGQEVTSALERLLDDLLPHREFLHRLRAEGGRAEFFIGWFFDGNSGDVFDCELLARLADLKIDLSLDMYLQDDSTDGDS